MRGKTRHKECGDYIRLQRGELKKDREGLYRIRNIKYCIAQSRIDKDRDIYRWNLKVGRLVNALKRDIREFEDLIAPHYYRDAYRLLYLNTNRYKYNVNEKGLEIIRRAHYRYLRNVLNYYYAPKGKRITNITIYNHIIHHLLRPRILIKMKLHIKANIIVYSGLRAHKFRVDDTFNLEFWGLNQFRGFLEKLKQPIIEVLLARYPPGAMPQWVKALLSFGFDSRSGIEINCLEICVLDVRLKKHGETYEIPKRIVRQYTTSKELEKLSKMGVRL